MRKSDEQAVHRFLFSGVASQTFTILLTAL